MTKAALYLFSTKSRLQAMTFDLVIKRTIENTSKLEIISDDNIDQSHNRNTTYRGNTNTNVQNKLLKYPTFQFPIKPDSPLYLFSKT